MRNPCTEGMPDVLVLIFTGVMAQMNQVTALSSTQTMLCSNVNKSVFKNYVIEIITVFVIVLGSYVVNFDKVLKKLRFFN
jgi:general stress protein CsbA